MQKKLLLIAVYFTMTGVCVNAQNKKQYPAPPPPPPPPPIENLAVAPPAPPTAPEAPTAPSEPSPVIVNGNGYDISIHKINGDGMIYLEKDGVKQKIKLSTWNANRKYYEKKYGQLPPPPPPPPAPPAPPRIIPDEQ
ncbi:MAG: hypothetical protein QM737_05120 [Ferruginibacter sp.]